LPQRIEGHRTLDPSETVVRRLAHRLVIVGITAVKARLTAGVIFSELVGGKYPWPSQKARSLGLLVNMI
jgi:hypothetical protein